MWCRKSAASGAANGDRAKVEKGPWRQCGAAGGADDKWAVGRATIWPVAFHTLHFTTCAVLFMARLWRQLATVTDPKEHRADEKRTETVARTDSCYYVLVELWKLEWFDCRWLLATHKNCVSQYVYCFLVFINSPILSGLLFKKDFWILPFFDLCTLQLWLQCYIT